MGNRLGSLIIRVKLVRNCLVVWIAGTRCVDGRRCDVVFRGWSDPPSTSDALSDDPNQNSNLKSLHIEDVTGWIIVSASMKPGVLLFIIVDHW
jgi:hypothetical protein